MQFFEKTYRVLLDSTVLGSSLPLPDGDIRSEEFITNVFGLQNHPDRGEFSFSFTEKLRETSELKIVPLIFISSILYHVAKYQKFQNGEMPRFITFSGTASKILHILDGSQSLKSITKLANQIFNDVFDATNARIELVIAKGPKEVTAKGGLMNPQLPTVSKSVFVGIEDKPNAPQIITLGDAKTLEVQNAVIEEVKDFVDRFFTWNRTVDYTNEFALDTRRFSEFKEILKSELDIPLIEGVKIKEEEMNSQFEQAIDETLFFLPLVGALSKLASYIIND